MGKKNGRDTNSESVNDYYFTLYRMVHEDVLQILLQRLNRVDG